jgi:hypothetical protein
MYQYWDSITKEDLEFSVGTKQGNWDLASKDPLLDQFSDLGGPHDRNSMYGVPTGRDSMYDTSSLDYRPVSHGNAMPTSRGYDYQQSYTGAGNAGAGTTFSGESRSRDRSSAQYQGSESRNRDRSSHQYQTQSQHQIQHQNQNQTYDRALMQHSNNSGNLGLLERRQSYGTPGAHVENRRSTQVHTGVPEDDDDVQRYISEARRQRRESERGSGREREREYAY